MRNLEADIYYSLFKTGMTPEQRSDAAIASLQKWSVEHPELFLKPPLPLSTSPTPRRRWDSRFSPVWWTADAVDAAADWGDKMITATRRQLAFSGEFAEAERAEWILALHSVRFQFLASFPTEREIESHKVLTDNAILKARTAKSLMVAIDNVREVLEQEDPMDSGLTRICELENIWRWACDMAARSTPLPETRAGRPLQWRYHEACRALIRLFRDGFTDRLTATENGPLVRFVATFFEDFDGNWSVENASSRSGGENGKHQLIIFECVPHVTVPRRNAIRDLVRGSLQAHRENRSTERWEMSDGFCDRWYYRVPEGGKTPSSQPELFRFDQPQDVSEESPSDKVRFDAP